MRREASRLDRSPTDGTHWEITNKKKIGGTTESENPGDTEPRWRYPWSVPAAWILPVLGSKERQQGGLLTPDNGTQLKKRRLRQLGTAGARQERRSSRRRRLRRLRRTYCLHPAPTDHCAWIRDLFLTTPEHCSLVNQTRKWFEPDTSALWLKLFEKTTSPHLHSAPPAHSKLSTTQIIQINRQRDEDEPHYSSWLTIVSYEWLLMIPMWWFKRKSFRSNGEK